MYTYVNSISTYLIGLFFTIILFYTTLLRLSMLCVKKHEIAIIMSITELLIIIYYVLFKVNIEVYSIIIIIVIMILFFYNKSSNLFLSIFYPTISILVVIAINNIITAAILYFVKIPFYSTRQDTILYYIFYLLTFLVTYILSDCLGILFKKLFSSSYLKIIKKISIYIAIFFLVTLIISYINTYLTTERANHSYLLLINALIFLVDCLFAIFLAYTYLRINKQDNEIKHNQELMQNLTSYVNTLESVNNEVKLYQHDIKNIMFSLSSFLDNKDYEGLEKFYNDNVMQIKNKDFTYNVFLSNLEKIHIPLFKGLLTNKLIEAINLGISVNVEVNDEINELEINIIDLIRITGILMDNAIEECKNIQNSYITFMALKETSSIKLVFINKLQSHIEDISQLYKLDYTTKENGHGIGLYNFKTMISKYDKITYKTYIKVDEFIQEITFLL